VNNNPHKNANILTFGDKSFNKICICLHGRGASAEDILKVAEEIIHQDMRCLAPQAYNHTWYPFSFLAPREKNEPYLSSALEMLEKIVSDCISKGISSESIILFGFSQGACLATEYVLSHPRKYGGLIAFTGGAIGEVLREYQGDLGGTPVFLGTSDPDPHVPLTRVEETAKILSALGADVTMKVYRNFPHAINDDQIEEAKKLIKHL